MRPRAGDLGRALRFAGTLAVFGIMPVLAQEVQTRPRDASWVAPEKQTAKSNPLSGQPAAAAGGQKVFQQRCASCHGDDGRGTSKAPDLTPPDVQAQSDGALFWKITSGNTHAGMPAFSFLPEPQRWQLVLHLRAIGARSSPAR